MNKTELNFWKAVEVSASIESNKKKKQNRHTCCLFSNQYDAGLLKSIMTNAIKKIAKIRHSFSSYHQVLHNFKSQSCSSL